MLQVGNPRDAHHRFGYVRGKRTESCTESPCENYCLHGSRFPPSETPAACSVCPTATVTASSEVCRARQPKELRAVTSRVKRGTSPGQPPSPPVNEYSTFSSAMAF